MTDASLNYVFDILKRKVSEYEPDWYETLGFLETHRIAGLFYSKSKELEIKLPVKVNKALKEVFEKQKRRVLLLKEYVKEISKELLENNVEHVFLKGSVFSNVKKNFSIYKIGERSSNDIDILVNQENISKVTNCLKKLGFIQGVYDEESKKIKEYSRLEIISRRMNRGEVAPFIKLTDNTEIPFIEVDINFSLGNTPNDHIDLLSFMIDSRVISNKNFALSILDNELFFIHLLLHQYKETTLYFMIERNKDLDIYKLADIYYLFKLNKIKRNRVKELAKKFNIEEKVGYVLFQVAEAFSDYELLKYAQRFGFSEQIIIDYESKKKYRMYVSIRTRLKNFNSIKFLEEVRDKPFYRWEFPIDYFRGNNNAK